MRTAFLRNPRNVVLVVAGAALLLWLALVWPSQLRLRARLQGLVPAEIVRITVQDAPLGSAVAPRQVVTLTDVECHEFLRLLANTHSFSPNHPQGGWTRFVRLVTREREFVFPISATSNNGTYLSLYSRGTNGWNLGHLRNDDLKAFVEGVFARHFDAGDAATRPGAPGTNAATPAP